MRENLINWNCYFHTQNAFSCKAIPNLFFFFFSLRWCIIHWSTCRGGFTQVSVWPQTLASFSETFSPSSARNFHVHTERICSLDNLNIILQFGLLLFGHSWTLSPPRANHSGLGVLNTCLWSWELDPSLPNHTAWNTVTHGKKME